MVGSMNAAIAGLKSHQSRMDVISNNIANVNTWGYKAQSANFTDTLYHAQKNGQANGGNVAGALGGINSSQIGYGVDIGSIGVNYTTGSRSMTGKANELMIDGPGFFIVGPYVADIDNGVGTSLNNGNAGEIGLTGEDGIMLSRVGILNKDNEGYLVDDSGNYVYGYVNRNQNSTDADPMDYTVLTRIRCKDLRGGEPGEDFASISFQKDGTITGVTKDGSTTVVIGKIAVANVSNANGLEKDGGYYYTIGPNAGAVTAMQTTKATGSILSGYLEMSNTNLADEIANMIITQRGYQANTKMITVTDEMLQELVNMKR